MRHLNMCGCLVQVNIPLHLCVVLVHAFALQTPDDVLQLRYSVVLSCLAFDACLT